MESIRDCDAWLRLQLQDRGLHLCDEIRKKAKKRGFTKQELAKARKVIGVKTFHQFDESGATTNWFWYLEG
ncbi:MAG: hypothetical protein QM793_06660 [Muricomes sp.]